MMMRTIMGGNILAVGSAAWLTTGTSSRSAKKREYGGAGGPSGGDGQRNEEGGRHLCVEWT